MKQKIRVRIADPAGNITIFVLDPFPVEQYQNIATQLLEMKELNGEQVAFITGDHSMNMCGLEFCGNASRAFALMEAMREGMTESGTVTVTVSGVDHPMDVWVDPANAFTRIRMQDPVSVQTITDCPYEGVNGSVLVDLGGIMHVIWLDHNAGEESFVPIRNYINETYDPPAMGVMYYYPETRKLEPVVYVRDVDSTYFEGSCGSGSTAVVIAHAWDKPDGTYSLELNQPAGTLTATAVKDGGKLTEVFIEGTVTYSPVQTVEVEI